MSRGNQAPRVLETKIRELFTKDPSKAEKIVAKLYKQALTETGTAAATILLERESGKVKDEVTHSFQKTYMREAPDPTLLSQINALTVEFEVVNPMETEDVESDSDED